MNAQPSRPGITASRITRRKRLALHCSTIHLGQGRRRVGDSGWTQSLLGEQLVVHAAALLVVVHHQHGQTSECLQRGRRRRRAFGHAEVGREMEHAPLVDLAFHPDASVHQTDQLRGNRQPQSGAAETPRGGTIGLAERLERCACLLRGMPIAGVANGDSAVGQCGRSSAPAAGRPDTSPRSVNLMAFPIRFTRICRTRPGSPISSLGHVGMHAEDQFQRLLPARMASTWSHRRRPPRTSKAAVLQLHLARFDFGEVENVVDQMAAGSRADCLTMFR